MHGWVKITPLQNTKIIFSQNSPAVRFQHQRFRKSETKKKLMALEFGVDLFFNLGPPERQCVQFTPGLKMMMMVKRVNPII